MSNAYANICVDQRVVYYGSGVKLSLHPAELITELLIWSMFPSSGQRNCSSKKVIKMWISPSSFILCTKEINHARKKYDDEAGDIIFNHYFSDFVSQNVAYFLLHTSTLWLKIDITLK